MLITIVTAVLNGEKYLEHTIRSVLDQDYPYIEYIVIDGGSTDGTIDIIKEYESRISYWVSEPDGGIADAMNKGIRQSSGNYLLFLHSDDYLVSKSSVRIAVQKMQLKQDLHSFPIYWERNGHRYLRRSRGFTPWINFKTGFYHQGVFFNRNIFKRLGEYETSLRIEMDYEFFLRAYREKSEVFIHHNPPLSTMRDTGISSRRDWGSLVKRFEEEKQIHKKHTNSHLLRYSYAFYWPAYIGYRRYLKILKSC